MTRAAHCTSCCTSVRRRTSPSRTSSRSCTRGCWNLWRSRLARTCGSKPPNWRQPPVLPVVDKERGHDHEANDRYRHTRGDWTDDNRSCRRTATAAISGCVTWATTGTAPGATTSSARGVAREASQKYNDHIERCNRAIEAAEHGISIPGADSDANDLKSQLASVVEQRDSYKRDRDLVTRDLQEKEKLIAEMSLRVDAVGKKTDSNQVAASSVDMSAADPTVVQLINNLQEQLYAERRENRRLKGA